MNSSQRVLSKQKNGALLKLTVVLLSGLILLLSCNRSGNSSGNAEVVVANMGNHSIMVYERNLNGSLADTPVRIIRGPATGLHNPFDVSLDGLGRIWVINLGDPPSMNPGITVYEPDANGNDSASFTFPLVIPDVINDKLFLPGSIAKFEGNKFFITGSSSPRTVPFPSNTNLLFSVIGVEENTGSIFGIPGINNSAQLINPAGIAFNANQAFVSTSSLPSVFGLYQVPNPPTSAVLIFNQQRGGSFNPVPVSMIAGNNTGLSNPAHMDFDESGNLYVINRGIPGNQNIQPSITVYGPGQTGDAAPLRTIQGPSTRLNSGSPYGIAVDENGFIYVSAGNSILVFDQTSSGNVVPVHIRSNTALSGSNNADLSSPVGIAVR